MKINGIMLGCSAIALMAPHVAQAQAAQSAAQSQPAGGQEAPAPAASESEIVVTAQFRTQNLQDTPIAITAVNSAMLEARSQTSVQDVANQAPSVTLKPQGAAFGPALGANIRGVGQFDFNPALEPGVGFYVDDVYFATLTGSIMDLLDLDRVEILRGRTQQTDLRIGALEVPCRERHRHQPFKDIIGFSGDEVFLRIAVTYALPARDR